MLTLDRLCLGLSFWLFIAVTVHAQGVHTLQGRVIAPNGTQPTNPVRVTLTYNGRTIYETFTDLSGRFSFTALAKGNYQLIAEGDGVTFETTSVYAEVSAFGSAPQMFTQDIHLRPIAGKPKAETGVVTAFNQDVPKAARAAFDRAMKASAAGQTQVAIDALQESIKLFTDFFEAHLALGNELIKADRLPEAITELDRARTLNSNDDRVYRSFGLVMMRQGNYGMAVAVFAEAYRKNPTNPLNSLMRGAALIRQAAMLDPSSSPQASADRKYLLERAEIALAEAARLSNGKVKADHLLLATLYELKGDARRAVQELEDYLKETPNAKNAEAIRAAIKKLRQEQ